MLKNTKLFSSTSTALSCVATLLLASSVALAQAPAATPQSRQAQSQGKELTEEQKARFKELNALTNAASGSPDISKGFTEEQKLRANAMAEEVVKRSLEALTSDEAKRFQAESLPRMKKRYDDIADETLQKNRNEALSALGIDPEGDAHLLYFVTLSMPKELLRSYLLEAMWSGGTVVLKGAPPGKKFEQFILEDISQLIHGKGAKANISIDPRLFDAYEIKVAPTIVFSLERQNLACQATDKNATQRYGTKAGAISFGACPPIDENKYWKIAGGISSDFALREIINAGGKEAQVFLDALSKGYSSGRRPGKEQVPFTGNWETAIKPEEALKIRESVETFQPRLAVEKSGVPLPGSQPPTQPNKKP